MLPMVGTSAMDFPWALIFVSWLRSSALLEVVCIEVLVASRGFLVETMLFGWKGLLFDRFDIRFNSARYTIYMADEKVFNKLGSNW